MTSCEDMFLSPLVDGTGNTSEGIELAEASGGMC